MNGLYFDQKGVSPGILIRNSTVRVGLTAQSYPFPAPTGIVDYTLRGVGERPISTVSATVGPHGG